VYGIGKDCGAGGSQASDKLNHRKIQVEEKSQLEVTYCRMVVVVVCH